MSRSSWFSIKAASNATADISIFSDIGGSGLTAQAFHDSLAGLGSRGTLRIAISSDGGDVSTGFAIYNMLNRHPAKKIVTVEGLAASMASVIAMAGDEIVMPENSMLMIHNPVGAIVGGADQMQSFADALAIMQDNIAQTYVDRSGQSMKAVQSMMDAETWLGAEAAVEKGFADRVAKPAAASARAFNLTRFSHVPQNLFRPARAEAARVESKVTIDPAAVYRKWNAAR